MAGISLITHKRGDTFTQVATIGEEFEDGYFSDWTPSCQIRDVFGLLVSTAQIAWGDPGTNRYLLIVVEDTSAWPISGWNLRMDIQLTRQEDGVVQSTETQQITVIRDVTYGN